MLEDIAACWCRGSKRAREICCLALLFRVLQRVVFDEIPAVECLIVQGSGGFLFLTKFVEIDL